MFREKNKNSFRTRLSLRQSSGFTLIELLVVIAIIGLLSSVVLVSVTKARRKARDVKRMGDIQQLNKAIQIYISEKGHAPYLGDATMCGAAAGFTLGSGICIATDNQPSWTDFGTDLSSYVKTLPHDPCGVKCSSKGSAPWYVYKYSGPRSIAAECKATPTCKKGIGELDNMYQIFAATLEQTGQPWGVNESLFSSFR